MLFNNNYSAIITKGLGAAACCSLLIAQFGLNRGCTVEIITPPTNVGGGGGGAFASSGFYVPFPTSMKKCDRIVLVTVKISTNLVWRKQFVVDVCNTDKIVGAAEFVNSTSSTLSVGVDKIKQSGRSVIASLNKLSQ